MKYQTIMNNVIFLFVLFQFFECQYFMYEWLAKRMKDFNFPFENQKRDGIKKRRVIDENETLNKHPNQSFNEDKNK